MSSRFPGMDPYIEGSNWANFHAALIIALRDALTPRVRPRFVVEAEQRVYIEHYRDMGQRRPVQPDLSVLEPRKTVPSATRSDKVGVTGVDDSPTTRANGPYVLTLPLPLEERETFLTIRQRETMDVVTVIEVPSPANKRAGSDGRREYLLKREGLLRSATHLVELDLLRDGLRLPTVESLPEASYYVFVSRGDRRPAVEVYPWSLRDRMPTIPVPLTPEEADVRLDLQTIFDELYDRSGYDYSLRYDLPLDPPPDEPDVEWLRNIVATAD